MWENIRKVTRAYKGKRKKIEGEEERKKLGEK